MLLINLGFFLNKQSAVIKPFLQLDSLFICLKVNIINGNGWGSKLEKIHTFTEDKLPPDAGFLDNETGDIYIYNNEKSIWTPKANTGLHYPRNSSSETIGQFMKNVKIYRGKEKIRDIYDVYKSTENDSICFIKKSYVQHWAVSNLPQRFLVTGKNAWDPHPINVTQAGLIGENYHTLADNDKGPCIIEHKNTLAILFHVENRRQETVKILDNFVIRKINSIQVIRI